MKHRRILFIKLSQFKLFIKKVLIALVFVSALMLMMLSKADTYVLNKTTGMISATLSPIIRIMQFPAQMVYLGYEKARDIIKVYSQNKQLREENIKLMILKNKVRTLEAENRLLGEMLNYISLPEAAYITAKVVAEEGDGFSHSLIVYVGDENRVYKDQVVMSDESVVGRVENVNGKYARVILITDINSKIPIIIERNRERAILSGDNTLIPKLLYTSLSTDIKEGDIVVTSGVAGVFPVGLPIGTVKNISKEKIEIVPMADIERLEFVKIVDYGIYHDVMNFSQENKEK
ncbi:MAG: rod shape-determining protein MreC [Alphaproteobacteria bacterium]|nr:rod shape-determining protein MreC [Alphaproteobacteria bacterium]